MPTALTFNLQQFGTEDRPGIRTAACMKGRRQTVSWIRKHKNIGRVAALIALLVAIMGPWLYSADGAPPAEWCRAPNFLLENERCVGLVSGATVLTFIGWAFVSVIAALASGATFFPDRAREFLAVFLFVASVCLIALPFLSTLFLIRRGDSIRLRVFHVVAWGFAAILGLLPVILDSALRSGRFWGIWLYIGLAISMLTLEILALATNFRRASKP
jgi:hypothetical protein